MIRTVNSLRQFLKQFVHSRIQRWLKSDEKRESDEGVLRLAPLYDEVKAVFCSLWSMSAMKYVYTIYWDQVLSLIVIDYRLNNKLNSAIQSDYVQIQCDTDLIWNV